MPVPGTFYPGSSDTKSKKHSKKKKPMKKGSKSSKMDAMMKKKMGRPF
jgi:hypothetical protein